MYDWDTSSVASWGPSEDFLTFLQIEHLFLRSSFKVLTPRPLQPYSLPPSAFNLCSRMSSVEFDGVESREPPSRSSWILSSVHPSFLTLFSQSFHFPFLVMSVSFTACILCNFVKKRLIPQTANEHLCPTLIDTGSA